MGDIFLRILAFIPCFNEAATIGKLLQEFEDAHLPIDLIVVDDGSSDNSYEIARQKCIVLKHKTNSGLCMAILTALKYAMENNYDYCIQIDGDGQHIVGEIKKFIDFLTHGNRANLLIGSRYYNRPLDSLFSIRRCAGWIVSLNISFLFGKWVYDPFSGMRMMDKTTISYFLQNIHANSIDAEILPKALKASLLVVEIPVKMRKREAGKSYLSGLNGVRFLLYALQRLYQIKWGR